MIDEKAWDDYDKLVKAAEVLVEKYKRETTLTHQLRAIAKEIVGSE